MVVLGQYGVERWNAAGDSYLVPPEPAEIDAVAGGAARAAGLARAGRGADRAQGPGGRRTHPDPGRPGAGFRRLEQPIRELAARHGLRVEPGKNVWEIRAPGVDKGASLRVLWPRTGRGR